MNRRDISARLDAFLRLQGLCAAIILASWLIFWAVGNPVRSLPDLFIYVLTQVNLTVVLLHPLNFFYHDERVRYYWPLNVISILVVNCVIVVASAAVIYHVDGLNFPFINFLHQTWKFPFVANLIFAFAYQAYKVTTRRLRRRNQQLQHEIEVETAQREVEAEELKQARDIQRGLLPKQIPQLPDFAIAGAWEPARVVGGDYYDVIRLSKDKVAICIADVAGKGISAALLMANVQAAVRAFASEYALPSKVCAQINSVLYTNTAPEKFATLFYGVLDARTSTLQYTNAGHPRPLLLHRSGATTHLENGGALLGVFPDWMFEDSVVELEPGDLLLMFTDGITEATDPAGEEFGEERVIAALDTEHHRSLDSLQSDLLAQVKNFCKSQLSDDATLLTVAATGMLREKKPALVRDKNADELISYAGALS
jgi:sigma-B regulation protein RsbU (phosphoserine phosphatase)